MFDLWTGAAFEFASDASFTGAFGRETLFVSHLRSKVCSEVIECHVGEVLCFALAITRHERPPIIALKSVSSMNFGVKILAHEIYSEMPKI